MFTRRGRFTSLLLVMVAAVMVFPPAASASIGASGSLQITGNNVSIDSPGHFAVLRVTNTNDGPQAGDSNTVANLSAALSCGSTRDLDNLCPTPDVGAIETATVAAGETGT